MILEKDNIAKCAHINKIRLNASEEQIYDRELADLFRWVEELAEVDTSAVSDTMGTRAAYLRPDDPVNNNQLADALVSAFNGQEGHCAKVKKVL